MIFISKPWSLYFVMYWTWWVFEVIFYHRYVLTDKDVWSSRADQTKLWHPPPSDTHVLSFFLSYSFLLLIIFLIFPDRTAIPVLLSPIQISLSDCTLFNEILKPDFIYNQTVNSFIVTGNYNNCNEDIEESFIKVEQLEINNEEMERNNTNNCGTF